MPGWTEDLHRRTGTLGIASCWLSNPTPGRARQPERLLCVATPRIRNVDTLSRLWLPKAETVYPQLVLTQLY